MLQDDKNREVTKMAVLATPKKNSYIIKKGCVGKIVNSKLSESKKQVIKENAALFVRNNIVHE